MQSTRLQMPARKVWEIRFKSTGDGAAEHTCSRQLPLPPVPWARSGWQSSAVSDNFGLSQNPWERKDLWICPLVAPCAHQQMSHNQWPAPGHHVWCMALSLVLRLCLPLEKTCGNRADKTLFSLPEDAAGWWCIPPPPAPRAGVHPGVSPGQPQVPAEAAAGVNH